MPTGSTTRVFYNLSTTFDYAHLHLHRPGAWLMHPSLVLVVKLSLDTLPGMTQQFSWTFVNLGYLIARPSLRRSRHKLIWDPRSPQRRYPTSCSTGQPASHSRRTCTAARMTTSRFGNKSTRASSLLLPRNGSFVSPLCCTYTAGRSPLPLPFAPARRTQPTPASAQVLTLHPLHAL